MLFIHDMMHQILIIYLVQFIISTVETIDLIHDVWIYDHEDAICCQWRVPGDQFGDFFHRLELDVEVSCVEGFYSGQYRPSQDPLGINHLQVLSQDHLDLLGCCIQVLLEHWMFHITP